MQRQSDSGVGCAVGETKERNEERESDAIGIPGLGMTLRGIGSSPDIVEKVPHESCANSLQREMAKLSRILEPK